MNVSTWFEIPVTDMDRAQRFYESVFNVTLQREEMSCSLCAIFPHEEGANSGSLTMGDGYVPSQGGVVVYLMVNDGVQAAIDRATAAGSSVILERTALPMEDAGFIALIGDSEGNTIGLHGMS